MPRKYGNSNSGRNRGFGWNPDTMGPGRKSKTDFSKFRKVGRGRGRGRAPPSQGVIKDLFSQHVSGLKGLEGSGWTDAAKRKVHAAYKRHVQPHVKQIAAHHQKHRKHLIKVLHKVRHSVGSYILGARRPKRIALSNRVPSKPKGLTKEASGFWDMVKKAFGFVKGEAVKHKDKIIADAVDYGKKHVKEGMDQAVKYGKDYAKTRLTHLKKKVTDKAKETVNKYKEKGGKYVKKYSDKVDKVIGYGG